MSPAHRVIDPGNLECARCHRPLRLATREPTPSRGKVLTVVRRWPDGMICSGCAATAQETFGTCPGCHTHRMLPGRNPTGQPCCTDCAGMPAMACTRCGAEGWMELRGVCGRCVLTQRLADALDDGTGRIRPELTALADRLAAMPRPRTGILWLNKPHVKPVLHAIATGQVPLTHDGLTTLQPVACVSYVRKLLVAAGTLPDYDHHLDRFERWLPGWLASIENGDQRAILTRYATWHLLRTHLAERAQQVAPAANPDSDWLFPGRLAGLAIQPNGVRQRLQHLGIPNAPGRCRALRELVLQAPPALIAPLLGFNTTTAEKIAAEAGNTWQRYAPGDHTPLAGTNR